MEYRWLGKFSSATFISGQLIAWSRGCSRRITVYHHRQGIMTVDIHRNTPVQYLQSRFRWGAWILIRGERAVSDLLTAISIALMIAGNKDSYNLLIFESYFALFPFFELSVITLVQLFWERLEYFPLPDYPYNNVCSGFGEKRILGATSWNITEKLPMCSTIPFVQFSDW